MSPVEELSERRSCKVLGQVVPGQGLLSGRVSGLTGFVSLINKTKDFSKSLGKRLRKI